MDVERLNKLVEKGIIEKVKVEIEGEEGKRVFARIGRQRKTRGFIAFRDQEGRLFAQAEDCIIQVLDEETGLCVYNTKGGYFHHLRLELGAKVGIFPKEFIQKLASLTLKEGEIMGFIGDAPVYFGGCITI